MRVTDPEPEWPGSFDGCAFSGKDVADECDQGTEDLDMTRRLGVGAAFAVLLMVTAVSESRAETPRLQAKHQGPCRDPWINYAFMEKVGRSPIGLKSPQSTHAKQDLGECNCNLYAGCVWSSYDQLERGVVSWNDYTTQARVVAKNVGGVFRIVKVADNTALGAVIRNSAGQLHDFMGRQLGGQAMSANARDLGNGTLVEFK